MNKLLSTPSLDDNSFFTLGDVLQLNSMQGARLLAGKTGLKNAVSRVSVVEVKDLAAWSEDGDLVLASGYAFRHNEEELINQIAALKCAGAAGLCIKSRAGQEISSRAVQQAELVGFPLLELPITAVFTNIVQESMEEILSQKIFAFQEVQSTTESLLRAMWQENDPERALQVVEETFHNPVMIFDNENDLLMTSKSQKLLKDGKLLKGGMLDELIRQLYNRKSRDVVTFHENGAQRSIPVQVFDANDSSGIRIIVMEYYDSLSRMDQIILGQIGHSLVLEMKNALAMKKIRRKYKHQFVEDLLSGRWGDDVVNICVAAQTDGYHLSLGKQYRVIVMNLNVTHGNNSFLEKDVSIIRHIIRNLDSNILFNVQQGKLILIMENEQDWNAMLQNLFLLAQKLNYVMNKGEMSFCISNPCQLQEIAMGYEQAAKISRISQRCHMQDQVITYDKLGILYLLSMLPENEVVRQYKDQYLEPLKEYDTKHNSNLLDTLKTYLATNCNKQETAELLHAHYNTIVYRITRIEKMLSLSLNDVESQLQLRIAFKLDLLC